MPHGNMTLVIIKLVTSCMIVACVIQSTKGKYNELKYIFHPLSM